MERGGSAPPHPPLSTKNCESDFCQLMVAHERSTKVGYAKRHPQSILQHFSNSVTDNNNNNNNNNKQNMAPAP